MPVYSGYNDAWETPGWTAQNDAYPPPGSTTNIVPPLPEITLSGTFVDDQGLPMNGLVKATPSQSLGFTTDNRQVFLDVERHELERGAVSFKIPIGDWSWEIVQRIGPVTKKAVVTPTTDIDLAVLFAGGIVDIIDGGSPTSTFTGTLDGGTP